jgi:hypothetical protein
MAGPARLDSLQLRCASPTYNHGRFFNAEIRMCPSALTELTQFYDSNYCGGVPVTVMAEDTLTLNWTHGGWHGFPFETPFDYDGTSSLLIEFRWQGDIDSAVYAYGWFPTGGPRTLDGYSLTSPTGTLRSYMSCLRIHYSAAGIAATPPGATRALIASPNPFRSLTVIRVPAGRDGGPPGIFDAAGTLVRTPVASADRVSWDGADDAGRGCRPGVYFLRLGRDGAPVVALRRL